jgi:hypothetical protein
MAESADDKAVDQCIQRMQDTLDDLKAEQSKDVRDEDAEEEKETPRRDQPKSLRDANRSARDAIRRGRGEKVRGSDGY